MWPWLGFPDVTRCSALLHDNHHMMQCEICNAASLRNCHGSDELAARNQWPCPLPVAVDKALHQPLRLTGQERSPEHTDAEVDRFLQRQFFPLPDQVFL